VSKLKAGDTLYLRQGTYVNQPIGHPSPQLLPSGTSWDNAITIASAPNETAILQGANGITLLYDEHYIIFDRIVLDGNGIFLDCDVHHIRFQNGEVKNSRPGDMLVMGCGSNFEVLNSKIHNAALYGFYWFGKDSMFDGNEVYDNAGYAYHIFLSCSTNVSNNSCSTNVSNNIVRNNTIHGNGFNGGPGGSGGLLISSGSNNQAYNNVVYGNAAGIQVDYGCTNCRVSNNTIYDNAGYGLFIGAGASGTIVEDNVIYQNGLAIENHSGGTIFRDNLMAEP
jgi:parallel beta-helix repeat protein